MEIEVKKKAAVSVLPLASAFRDFVSFRAHRLLTEICHFVWGQWSHCTLSQYFLFFLHKN